MWAWDLAAVLGCIALSAFFSASETALTSLGPIKTQRLIEEGGRWNKSLVRWHEKPLEVLTCILIGNNIVNITASTMAASLAQNLLDSQNAIPIAIGVMTFLVLTFGEITPKTIAKARAEKLAGVFMWFLWLPYYVFLPGTFFFVRMTRLLMKVTGEELSFEAPKVTEEDIEFLVRLGHEHGNLGDAKEKLLSTALDYTETNVHKIMIPRVNLTAIECGWGLEEVTAVLMESGHSRMPVYEGTVDKIVGLFYAKDLLRVYSSGQPKEEFRVKDFLRDVEFVPEQMKISDLLSFFQKSRVHMAIVVDEFGGTSGLITLEDIIEEFFGEIRDEYDVEEDFLQEQQDGSFEVPAHCPLDAVADHFDIEFPEAGDYDSLGGFIVAHTGLLPDVGAVVRYSGLNMEVVEADERRVIKVLITRDPGQDLSPGEVSFSAA